MGKDLWLQLIFISVIFYASYGLSNLVAAKSSIRPKHYQSVVVGGGLCGLSTAYHLQKTGNNVLLCEAAQRVGGHVASKHGTFLFIYLVHFSDIFPDDRFVWELGPNSFQPTNTIMQLSHDLNIQDKLVYADPNLPRFVVRQENPNSFSLAAVPMSISQFIMTPILSFMSKVKVLAHFLGFYSPHSAQEESVAQFMTRHFGSSK